MSVWRSGAFRAATIGGSCLRTRGAPALKDSGKALPASPPPPPTRTVWPTGVGGRRDLSGGAFPVDAEHLSTGTRAATAAAAADRLDPLRCRDRFGVGDLFTVEDLFKARVHLGHKVAVPQMRPFLYGVRFGVHIIDLDETAALLRQALNFLAHVSARGGIVLFVARQPHLVHAVERVAIECNEYAHCRPWSSEIFCAPQMTFGGQVRLPDVVVLAHTKSGSRYTPHQAIVDAAKVGIPTVGVVDTDCNPNLITYPIPGNDDTFEASRLYLDLFKRAVLLGKQSRKETPA